jgi:hypothetical protein
MDDQATLDVDAVEVIEGFFDAPKVDTHATVERMLEGARAEHLLCTAAKQTELWRARRAGEWFAAIKKKLRKQGDKWEAWVKENVKFCGVRRVSDYMRVAKEWGRVVEANRQRAAELSVREFIEIAKRLEAGGGAAGAGNRDRPGAAATGEALSEQASRQADLVRECEEMELGKLLKELKKKNRKPEQAKRLIEGLRTRADKMRVLADKMLAVAAELEHALAPEAAGESNTDELTTEEVAERAGVTAERMDTLRSRGYFTPPPDEAGKVRYLPVHVAQVQKANERLEAEQEAKEGTTRRSRRNRGAEPGATPGNAAEVNYLTPGGEAEEAAALEGGDRPAPPGGIAPAKTAEELLEEESGAAEPAPVPSGSDHPAEASDTPPPPIPEPENVS